MKIIESQSYGTILEVPTIRAGREMTRRMENDDREAGTYIAGAYILTDDDYHIIRPMFSYEVAMRLYERAGHPSIKDVHEFMFRNLLDIYKESDECDILDGVTDRAIYHAFRCIASEAES